MIAKPGNKTALPWFVFFQILSRLLLQNVLCDLAVDICKHFRDLTDSNWITAIQTFYQIWISGPRSVIQWLLTHWGRDKMAAISKTTFSHAFSWMKMYEFRLRFHWSLFLMVQLTALVQIMAWHRPGDKPLSEPMLVSLLTHMWVTRPQWVKSLFAGWRSWWEFLRWSLQGKHHNCT